MTTILATHLAPDHVGQRVAFYAHGRRVCGRLEAYCRHHRSYSLMVDGSWLKQCVSVSAEIDLIEVAA